MEDFNELLINFKSLKTKKKKLLECLQEDKKKKLDQKQFELDNEISKESKLDEKRKQFEIFDNRDQGTKSTKQEKTNTKET